MSYKIKYILSILVVEFTSNTKMRSQESLATHIITINVVIKTRPPPN